MPEIFMVTAPTKLEITFGNDLDRGFVAHNRSFANKKIALASRVE